jgi:hypothetical protein
VFVGAALVLGALAALPWLAIDGEAQVAARDEVRHEDVARVVALWRSQQTRQLPSGAVRVLVLREREVDLLLNHMLHRGLRSRVEVLLERGAARVRTSTPLPAGAWLNLSVRVVERGGLPGLDSVRIGQLPLPTPLARLVLRLAVSRHEQGPELRAAASMVQRVSIFPQRLSVVYAWDPQARQRMLATLVPPEDQQRLRGYHERLVAFTSDRPPAAPIALSTLLPPLFALARERTQAGHDPAAENRAALLLLTLFASGRPLENIVPAAREWPPAPPLRVTLADRDDFALHFLISATIAIDGTSPLSRAAGVYKEMADAHGGSGFSFNDLAADRAGTRLGEAALTRPQALQERLAAPLDDAALMPPWRDLPEFLTEAEFGRRFGGVGAPEYERLLAEIDRRIAALPLWR